MPVVAVSKEKFDTPGKLEGSQPARLDLIDVRLREELRQRLTKQKDRVSASKEPTVDKDYQMPHFDPLIVPKLAKQEVFRGDKSNFYYMANDEPHFTHNRGILTYPKMTDENKAKILDKYLVSCISTPSPDPQYLSTKLK